MSSDTTPSIPDLLRRIPLSTRVLLEVGCGRGELSASFRHLNPTARLLGIEPDPDAAGEAAEHLDEVAAIDVEQEAVPFEVSNGIDCIVYRHILETLNDPWAVIRRHAKALSPNGVMVICVPNPDHWTVADRLLRGVQNGAADDVPDPRHLHWFSLAGMRRRLVDCGLTLCDAQPGSLDTEAAETFTAALEPALIALGIDPDAYAKRATPRHFIWRVRKMAEQRLTIAANMLPPVGGVSHVRVVYPLQAMSTDPLVTAILTEKLEAPPATDPATPRIFVLHRPALVGAGGFTILRRLIDAGWVVVTEFDDHPDFFTVMQQGNVLSFRGVHAVQTSTPALADVLRPHNPELTIFPNAMISLPSVHNFANPDSLTLFFAALNRESDWRSLMPAINAVAAKAGGRLKFQIVHDQAFYEALETPHKTFTPTCDHERYMSILGHSDISFMPLADTAFNRTKSDLKFIEAGACRVASLASSVVYGNSIADGQTGLLFQNPGELHTRLLRLVAMPELARTIGDRARYYVATERMTAYQVAPRLRWYRSLWARRAALTEAVRARLINSFQTAA
jgi:SAM-dependent methyltransferase